MESRIGDDMKRLDERGARLEHSQAKLKELMKGLRKATTRPNVARRPPEGIPARSSARLVRSRSAPGAVSDSHKANYSGLCWRPCKSTLAA